MGAPVSSGCAAEGFLNHVLCDDQSGNTPLRNSVSVYNLTCGHTESDVVTSALAHIYRDATAITSRNKVQDLKSIKETVESFIGRQRLAQLERPAGTNNLYQGP